MTRPCLAHFTSQLTNGNKQDALNKWFLPERVICRFPRRWSHPSETPMNFSSGRQFLTEISGADSIRPDRSDQKKAIDAGVSAMISPDAMCF
jgi:hypothetical protein